MVEHIRDARRKDDPLQYIEAPFLAVEIIDLIIHVSPSPLSKPLT